MASNFPAKRDNCTVDLGSPYKHMARVTLAPFPGGMTRGTNAILSFVESMWARTRLRSRPD